MEHPFPLFSGVFILSYSPKKTLTFLLYISHYSNSLKFILRSHLLLETFLYFSCISNFVTSFFIVEKKGEIIFGYFSFFFYFQTGFLVHLTIIIILLLVLLTLYKSLDLSCKFPVRIKPIFLNFFLVSCYVTGFLCYIPYIFDLFFMFFIVSLQSVFFYSIIGRIIHYFILSPFFNVFYFFNINLFFLLFRSI